MKVDNNTLNFLARGAEHVQGPRAAHRVDEDVFGAFFASNTRPVERSQKADSVGGSASSQKAQATSSRESSDDAIEAVRPGQAESPERDVEESESKRPEDSPATDEQDGQPEVGQVDVNAKSDTAAKAGGEKSTDGESAKTDGQTKETQKPVAKAVVPTPTGDRPVAPQATTPTTEADQAAKVLDQIRQPVGASGQSQKGSEPTALASPQQVAQAGATATADAVVEQAAIGAADARASGAPKPVATDSSAGNSTGAETRAAVPVPTPDPAAESGGEKAGRDDGDGQERANRFTATRVNADAAPQALSGDAPETKPVETAERPHQSAPAPLQAAMHVSVDDAGAAARPAGQSGASAGSPIANAQPGALPEAEATRVTDRVVKSLSTMAATRGGTVTLRLTPLELGTLRIQVTMSGGSVQATFEASTAAVGRLLEQNATTLRNSLEGQGLNVDRINVQVNSSNASNASTQQNAGDSPTDGRSRGMTDGGSRQSGDQGSPPNDQHARQAFSDMLDLVA